MMHRIRQCRDGLWYVQQKCYPGLRGGIWRRIGVGCLTEGGAQNLRLVLRA